MEQSEVFKDWLFRYQYVYRLRRTEKSKKRFLAALVTDIAKIREDVRVIEYDQQKKYASRNVYVGNIKQADRVICTFYDTPPESIGSYQLFDRKDQAKKTTMFILTSTLITKLVSIQFGQYPCDYGDLCRLFRFAGKNYQGLIEPENVSP